MNELSTALPTAAEASRLEADFRQPKLLGAIGRLADDHRTVLVAICALGLGLRIWDLGRRSFWLDELSAVGTSALSFGELLRALTVEANMTLYYWALFVWLRIVGLGADEALIRLPSAVAGATAVPLTYLLGRRLHSRTAGLAAAALLAVNGYHVLLSQEARAYAALSGLTILSYLLLDRALEHGRWRDWTLHGLVTALAFYCHFYTAFTVLAQGLFVLSRRSRAAMIGLVGSGAIMMALLAQLAPFFVRQSNGAKLSHLLPPDANDVLNFFVDFSGGARATLAIYAALAALGMTLARPGSRRAAYRNSLLLTWFCVPVGLALGVSLTRPIFNDRYLFAALPALPLMAGVGLTRLPRAAALAGVAALVLITWWTLQGDFDVRRTEQWREAVAYVTSNARSGDGWIFISKWGQNGFEYYAGWQWGHDPHAPYADVLEPFNWDEAFAVPKYRGLLSLSNLEAFSISHPRIWLVLSHEFDSAVGGDTAAPVRDWLTRHGYAATQRQFRFVRVLLYQRRETSV